VPYSLGGVGATRCTADTNLGARCALAEGHQNLHVTLHGQRFVKRGGPLLFEGPWPAAGTAQPMQCTASHPDFTKSRCELPRFHVGMHVDGNITWPKVETRPPDHRVDALRYAFSMRAPEPTFTPQQVDAYVRAITSGLGKKVAELEERLAEVTQSVTERMQRLDADIQTGIEGSGKAAARKFTALLSVEAGGGLQGLRRDINRMVGLVGEQAWNGRKELATREDLDDAVVQGKITAEAVDRLENQTAQLGKLAQCSAYSGNDGDRYCVRVNHHDGTHLGEDGFAW
jgi:BMFP domain-containing protein YqiC